LDSECAEETLTTDIPPDPELLSLKSLSDTLDRAVIAESCELLDQGRGELLVDGSHNRAKFDLKGQLGAFRLANGRYYRVILPANEYPELYTMKLEIEARAASFLAGMSSR
jgi:hypothetical protein